MRPPLSWDQLARHTAEAPPLVYVHGMRFPVCLSFNCGWHSHDDIEIVYHPTGRGTSRLRSGRELSFEEGSVVIYGPKEEHDQRMTRSGEDLCVHVKAPDWFVRFAGPALHLPRIEIPSIIADIQMLARGHMRLRKLDRGIFNYRATTTLLTLIHLACVAQPREGEDAGERHVRKAEVYIHEKFPVIQSLREIAAHAQISPDHLRHSFKRLRGKSLVHYLNEVRVEQAKSLLIHSRLPLKQIASMTGYRDEYYFSNVFRKFAGLAPGVYRRRG